MRKNVCTILLLLLVFLLTGCGDIKVAKSEEEYRDSYYEDVSREFHQLGFRNIETVEIADLTSSGSIPDGSVSEVSIDGTTGFSAKESFSKDAEVVITYHIIKKLSVPVTYDQISDMNQEQLAAAFTEAGFTNVQTEELYDLDPDETAVEQQNEVKVNDTALTFDADSIPFDADVAVICHFPYKKYDVHIKVDFTGNLLFSKYDVDLSIDGEIKDTLKHGKDWEEVLRLKEGEHTVTFTNTEDSTVNGKVLLEVNGTTEVEYKIACSGNEVTAEVVYLDCETELSDNEIKMAGAAADYLGQNYKEAEKALRKLGFVNIQVKPVYDIFFGVTEEESVSDISINASSDFRRGDIFLNDAEIIITYHMPYEEDPDRKEEESHPKEEDGKPTEEESADEVTEEKVVNQSYVYVRDLMNELGYTAEYEHEYSHMDLTGELAAHSDEELNGAGFIITGIKEMNSQEKTITMYVNTNENIERVEGQKATQKVLEENFDPSVAMAALELYGKSQCPYGFKLHGIVGKLAETPVDENTWFMKYKCEVTNAAGEKVSMTCEAKIKGPEDNPTVYDFYLY